MKHINSTFCFAFLLSGVLITSFSCQEPTEPQKPDNRSLSLSLTDVDVFTASLSLETKDMILPATLTLTRNGEIQSSFSLHKPDTTIYDSTLKASTDYTWQVLLKKGDQIEKSSNVLTARTLDTTSHDFTWRVDTLGYFLSIVRDVAIIDDNNIWAVGTFYKKHANPDSTVMDEYGIAIWNGVEWKLKREYYIENGKPDLNSSVDPEAIFVVSPDEIWMSAGRTLIRSKNGRMQFFNTGLLNEYEGISKIWAKDANNVYFVGIRGAILFYDGSSFTRIPYPENINFVDIWGDKDGVVRAVGNQLEWGWASVVVKLTSTSVTNEVEGLNREDLDENVQTDIFTSVWWSDSRKTWFVGNNGVSSFQNKKFKRLFSNAYGENNNHSIFNRGKSNTDIMFCGIYGQVFHFNGATIEKFNNFFQSKNPSYRLDKISYNGRIVCLGGSIGGTGSFEDQTRAIVVIGKRN